MKKNRIIGFVLFIVLIALLYLLISDTITFEWLKMQADQLRSWTRMHYVLVVCLYLIVFFFSSIFFLPLNTLLLISAGFLFGFWPGFLWAQVGFCFGSLFSMLLVRYLIGSWIQKKYNHKLESLNQKIEANGAPYLLFIQLLPITPTPLLNMSVGFTTISWWTFLWTTFAGTAIGNGLYVYAGKFLHQLESTKDILSWPLFIIFCVMALLALIPFLFSRYMVN